MSENPSDAARTTYIVRESRNERDARDVGDKAGVVVQEVRLTA
jgi:hypothetical protein